MIVLNGELSINNIPVELLSYSKWYIEIIGKMDDKIINISIFIYQSHGNKLRNFLYIVEFSV